MQVSIDNLSKLPAALEEQYNTFRNERSNHSQREYNVDSLGVKALVEMNCERHDMGGRAFGGMSSTFTATTTITPKNEEVKTAIQNFLSSKTVVPFGCMIEMEVFSEVKFS